MDVDKQIALFQDNIKLTYYFAKNYFVSVPEQFHEDLCAEARIGLWKACTMFDESRGAKFSSYAAKAILSQLNTFMRAYRKGITNERSFEEIVDGTENITLGDVLGHEQDFDNDIFCEELIKKVSSFKLINLVYIKELKQVEVAKTLGVSHQYLNKKLKMEKSRLLQQISI